MDTNLQKVSLNKIRCGDKEAFDRLFKNFAYLMKKYRSEKNMTQKDLAGLLDVSQNYLGECERMNHTLNVKHTIQAILILGIPIWEIIGKSKKVRNHPSYVLLDSMDEDTLDIVYPFICRIQKLCFIKKNQ